MRFFHRLLAMCAFIVTTAVWSAELPSAPGIYEQTLTTGQAKELRYSLSLPPTFQDQGSFPLVVALHYGGDVTPWYGKRYLTVLVEPGLRELGAILVAPDCPTKKGWDNATAETAVLELMNDLKQHYKIDEHRILITGFSMGGVGTRYLASRHPKLFSAAIAVSGLPDADAIKTINAIPMYAIHGSSDDVFPLKKLEGAVQKLSAKGFPVQLKVAEGVSHYQTASFVAPLQDAIPWIRQIWSATVVAPNP